MIKALISLPLAGLMAVGWLLSDGSTPSTLAAIKVSDRKETPTSMSNSTEGLEGTLWRLTHYISNGELEAVLADSEATLQLEAGRIYGSGSCNRYFGSYSLSDNGLSIQPGGTTQMACLPEIMAQEQAFLGVLPQVNGFALEGNELRLQNPQGETILVLREFTSPPLTNTQWHLQFYNNGRGALVSPIAGTSITATFSEAGRVAGEAGCNNYFASYELNDGITIGRASSTRKYCSQPEGVMEQESRYLKALESSVSFSLSGNQLELKNAEGTVVAQYRASE